MARITPDGFTKIHFVPLANVAAYPVMTEAELNSGTELTPFTTPAGLDTPEEGTDADSSDLSDVIDKSVPATIGGDMVGEFYRDDGTGGFSDDAWTALPRLTDGYLVVGRFGGTGTDNALILGDSVESTQVRVSQRSNNRIVRGETLRFTARFARQTRTINITLT